MFKGVFIRFPKGKTKALTFSYDDGVEQDLRLLDIFNKYNLKGTFNINTGKEKFRSPEGYKAYEGHEVALHTVNHPLLEASPDNARLYEIFHDREMLEKCSGKIVRGMAYPYRYDGSAGTQKALDACGIAYSRVTNQTNGFKLPVDNYFLQPTCHHKDPKLFELLDTFINTDLNKMGVDKAVMLFYVWGHSYEFDTDDNWETIEEFAKKASGNPEVWYATNIEIIDYIEKFKRLQFSLDSHIVYNPNDISIFFNVGNKEYEIKSGETKHLEF